MISVQKIGILPSLLLPQVMLVICPSYQFCNTVCLVCFVVATLHTLNFHLIQSQPVIILFANHLL